MSLGEIKKVTVNCMTYQPKVRQNYSDTILLLYDANAYGKITFSFRFITCVYVLVLSSG